MVVLKQTYSLRNADVCTLRYVHPHELCYETKRRPVCFEPVCFAQVANYNGWKANNTAGPDQGVLPMAQACAMHLYTYLNIWLARIFIDTLCP
jgi:hypothetical protein